ncbi:sel1 repeat family protein [Vibrio sp. JC009]|uniref:tetratricopeptide repeat protein n=1 Tax=Vibrio sp. JC009 TaxID=2912314 RepID=UPI0023AFE603|nr:tetratricopeptide repeat protein [Vibrio sp. JC009]WED24911.1 sel1 repeat family protein [Vibrio sp. JC009]
MTMMTIVLSATGIAFLVIIGWMAMLSGRKKKLAMEKLERERAYRKAIERQREQEKQERLFKAETGHVPTQLYLAKESEIHNPREALYWYERAAMQDNEIAMYGVVRVCARAKEDVVLKQKSHFWQIAIEAHNGSPRAKFEMGKALISGIGVDINIEKGIQVIEEVANDGNAGAQVFMGDWYIAESNKDPKPKLSAEWHFRAAQQNNTDAQVKLGIHYRDGVGVTKNITRAIYWFEVAGERGSAEGQYFAGDTWIGRGSKGNAIAYLWLYLAAHFGWEPAKSKRDDLGNILGVDGVVGLQSMAKPLVKKLTEGALEKHSLINALNKLYKRDSYFPERDGNEFMTAGPETQEPNGEKESKDSESNLDFSMSPMNKSDF